jgi:hypothetical protein
MNMRDNIPITTTARRGRPACLPLCNDVCPMCGVSLQRGVAGNAPTVAALHGKHHRKTGNFRGEMGRHAGLPLHFRNPNVGATLAVALNAHTHTQGANTTIQNSTITAQGDRKGRPYGADITTGDIT